MTTIARLENLNVEMIEWLSRFFEITKDENGDYIDHEIHTGEIVRRLLDSSLQEPTIEYCVNILGSKWINITNPEIDVNEAPNSLELNITSAWSFPEGLIQRLFDKLSSFDNKVVIKGSFHDETYSPTGVFFQSQTLKETVVVYNESLDEDRMWDDDSYREKVFEALEDQLLELEMRSRS